MLLGSAIAAIAVAGPAQAFEASFGGQVDRMIRYGNNGDATDVQHLDNGPSNSRIHFTGSGEMMDGVVAGIFAEVGLDSNRSDDGAFDAHDGDINDGRGLKDEDDSDNVTVRWAEVFFETQWGKFSAGQGEEATRGIPYMSLAGTELVDGNDFRNFSGMQFQDGVNSESISEFFNNYDGDRTDRLRYDTPNMSGFVGSASTANDSHSVAIRYHGQFEMVELLAGAGWNHDPFDQDNFTVTASGLMANGFSLTGSYGHRSRDEDSSFANDNNFENNFDGHSSNNWLAMLGYRINDCAFSVSYGRTNDEAFDGDTATHWGVGFQKHFPSVNMDAYIGYRHFDFDGQTESEIASLKPPTGPSTPVPTVTTDFHPDNIDAVVVGARIKF
jgi:predicted porin